MKKLLLFLVVIALLFAPYPQYYGYVNDYANVLSPQYKAGLEQKISDFERNSSVEIAVVILPQLADPNDPKIPADINIYAAELFHEWKIGKKGEDNGILLLIAMNDKKLRLEVGYGLEGTIPDTIAKKIIDNEITPYFKEGRYDEGVMNGVDKIIETIQKKGYTPTVKKDDEDFMCFLAVFLGIFLFIIIIFVITMKYGKGGGYSHGGGGWSSGRGHSSGGGHSFGGGFSGGGGSSGGW
ncbi:MAG: TPM domain-containing protein [Candidatus Micrarchaeota archaeon]